MLLQVQLCLQVLNDSSKCGTFTYYIYLGRAERERGEEHFITLKKSPT